MATLLSELTTFDEILRQAGVHSRYANLISVNICYTCYLAFKRQVSEALALEFNGHCPDCYITVLGYRLNVGMTPCFVCKV